MVVVDPGVGTSRRPLAVQAANRFFVGPDNGVLTPALTLDASAARVIEEPQEGAPERRNEVKGEADLVEVTVADTGVGIAPEVLERIFDPFFTTKRDGSGLGLATVHRIVEANGGSLRVESRVGKGTVLRVRFPRPGKTP